MGAPHAPVPEVIQWNDLGAGMQEATLVSLSATRRVHMKTLLTSPYWLWPRSSYELHWSVGVVVPCSSEYPFGITNQPLKKKTSSVKTVYGAWASSA